MYILHKTCYEMAMKIKLLKINLIEYVENYYFSVKINAPFFCTNCQNSLLGLLEGSGVLQDHHITEKWFKGKLSCTLWYQLAN